MGLTYGGVYLFIVVFVQVFFFFDRVVFVQVNVIGQIFYCVILMHNRTRPIRNKSIKFSRKKREKCKKTMWGLGQLQTNLACY